ncbi:MAG TPA: hypothetical protein VIT23_12140 [Terrimicrobiaceae bacterium]
MDIVQEEEKQRQDAVGRNTPSDDKAKTIDRLVNLWIHQNTLLWNRLQTLTALQVAVLGGWYYFYFSRHTFTSTFLALLIALLGVLLSLLIRELTNCDASRRDSLRKRVQDLDLLYGKVIFPEVPEDESTDENKGMIRTLEMWIVSGVFLDRLRSHKNGEKRIRGLWVMERILGIFCVIDIVLTVIAFMRLF